MKKTPSPPISFTRLKEMGAQGATQKELVTAFLNMAPKGSRQLPYGVAWEVLVARGVITPRTRRIKVCDMGAGREWPAGAVPFVPPEAVSWRKERDAAQKKAIADGWYSVSSTPKAIDLEALKATCATEEELIEAFRDIPTPPGILRLSCEDARAILIEEHLITPSPDNPVSEG